MGKDSDINRFLATVWVCLILGILIMLTRLILGHRCKKKFDLGDALTCAAICISVVRIPLVHVIIIWQTNNIYPALGEGGIARLGAEGVRQHEIGSKFVLASRCLYISLLWTQKSVLLVFYTGIINDLPLGRKVITYFWGLLLMTWAGSITATFTGCKPFEYYWKVLPVTDPCVQAIPQLFVVGCTNLLTDILLILLPIPVLIGANLDWRKELQLGFLFSVGLVIIAVTAVRLPRTFKNVTSERQRITWTTGECLAATFVANAPTLYSFRKLFRKRNSRAMQSDRSGPHIRANDLSGTTFTEFTREEPEHRASIEVQEPNTKDHGNTKTLTDTNPKSHPDHSRVQETPINWN